MNLPFNRSNSTLLLFMFKSIAFPQSGYTKIMQKRSVINQEKFIKIPSIGKQQWLEDICTCRQKFFLTHHFKWVSFSKKTMEMNSGFILNMKDWQISIIIMVCLPMLQVDVSTKNQQRLLPKVEFTKLYGTWLRATSKEFLYFLDTVVSVMQENQAFLENISKLLMKVAWIAINSLNFPWQKSSTKMTQTNWQHSLWIVMMLCVSQERQWRSYRPLLVQSSQNKVLMGLGQSISCGRMITSKSHSS